MPMDVCLNNMVTNDTGVVMANVCFKVHVWHDAVYSLYINLHQF